MKAPIIRIILAATLPLLLFSFTSNNDFSQKANAQNLKESTAEKLYVLLFEQNKIGNIDNSTKLVSAIVGKNLIKIEEELLEEISLAPSQELEDKVKEIISNGTAGFSCDVSLTTEDGKDIGIDCISSGNHIIWHIYPK